MPEALRAVNNSKKQSKARVVGYSVAESSVWLDEKRQQRMRRFQ